MFYLSKWKRTVFLIFLFPLCLQAQQDPMYSQYMFNGSAFNPAYAGSRDALSMSILHRQQWRGFSGAPVTSSFAVHAPSANRRHGIGLSLVNDEISYLGQTWFNLDYAWRLPIGKGNLSFGLRATLDLFRIKWEEADFKDRTDIVALNYPSQSLLPNAGFGMRYSSKSFYIGVAVPHLLINPFDSQVPELSLSDTGPGRLRRHYFTTAGAVLKVGDNLQFKPSVLGKYVVGAPFQMDLNLNVYFIERFGLGASYRTGDALVGLLDVFLSPQLRLGYAYGYPVTELSNQSSGSHELMLGYDFRFKKGGIASPRLF